MKVSLFCKILSFFVLVEILLGGCAKESQPLGGPRDVLPPKVKSSSPACNAIHTRPKKIVISFDEFITLDNASQKMLVSPPMEEKPVVTTNGKSIKLVINPKKLADSCTYSVTFPGIIKDLNEGNVLSFYTYVFSTGDSIDKMRIRGRVIDSWTKKPIDNIYVMAYKNLSDSAPRKLIPTYVTRTSNDGTFSITNVKQGSYRLYALKDVNNNMIYDQPKEEIAFHDSVLTPRMMLKTRVDTIRATSRDTIVKDSLARRHKRMANHPASRVVLKDSCITRVDTVFTTDSIVLKLFEEEKMKQFVVGIARERKEKIVIGFNKPLLEDSVSVVLLNSMHERAFVRELTPHHDTLILWLADTAIRNVENVKVVLGYFTRDSSGQLSWETDTLKPRYDRRKDPQRGAMRCSVTFPVKENESFNAYHPFRLITNDIVKKFDPTKCVLSESRDTLSLQNTLGQFYELDSLKRERFDSFHVRPARPMEGDTALFQNVSDIKFGRNKFMIRCQSSIARCPVRVTANGIDESQWCIKEEDSASNILYYWIVKPQVLGEKAVFVVSSQGKNIDTVVYKPKKQQSRVISQLLEVSVPKVQAESLCLDEKIVLRVQNPIDTVCVNKIQMFVAKDTSRANVIVNVERKKDSPRSVYITARVAKNTTYTLKVEQGALVDMYGNKNEDQDISIVTQKMRNNTVLKRINTVSISKDSASMRGYIIACDWRQKTMYEVQFLPGAFENILGVKNDTLRVRFRVADDDEYGTMILSLRGISTSQLVLQLMDKEEKKVFAEQYVDASKDVVFKRVKAGEYRLKAIVDVNGNRKWDTGNVLHHVQPEEVLYLNKQVTIKAKWDNKIEWDITKNQVEERAPEDIKPGKETTPVKKK